MIRTFRAPLAVLSFIAASALATTAVAQAPAKDDGRRADQRRRHDAVHVRQGCGRQERLQRSLRRQLAPAVAAGDAKASGDWTIVTRDDGGKQWAYKGKPVYLWAKDQKPGDKTGDGFNSVWHVVKP